jgi:hypothetical protein
MRLTICLHINQAFINKYDHVNHFPLMFTKNSLLFFYFFMWIAQRAYLVFCYSPEQPCSLRRSPVVTTAGTAATPPLQCSQDHVSQLRRGSCYSAIYVLVLSVKDAYGRFVWWVLPLLGRNGTCHYHQPKTKVILGSAGRN